MKEGKTKAIIVILIIALVGLGIWSYTMEESVEDTCERICNIEGYPQSEIGSFQGQESCVCIDDQKRVGNLFFVFDIK